MSTVKLSDEQWVKIRTFLHQDPHFYLICRDNPSITTLVDYEQFCGMPAHDRSLYQLAVDEYNSLEVQQISPVTLKRRLESEMLVLLDVREPHEWEIVNLAHLGASLISKDAILERMNELDTAAEMVVYCRDGVQSAIVVDLLQQHGFQKLYNPDGGINAWAETIEPNLLTYQMEGL